MIEIGMMIFFEMGVFAGARRHAHENWNTIRYRYIHLYVRLEEGGGPGYKVRRTRRFKSTYIHTYIHTYIYT